jgi:hypothetical protein
MARQLAGLALALGMAALFLVASSDAQEKKREGTIIGVLKAHKDSKDGKNTFIDVLSPGEEKPRAYHVLYDAKLKGPIPSVLSAVRAAKIGDMVELAWVETGHGPAMKSFKVLKKAAGEK